MLWSLGVIFVLAVVAEVWQPGLAAAGINPAVLVGMVVLATWLSGVDGGLNKNPWPRRIMAVPLAIYVAMMAMSWTAGPDLMRVVAAVLSAIVVVIAMW